MRYIFIILIIILLSLQYKLWVGDGSLSSLKFLEKKIIIQTQKNKVILKKNKSLTNNTKELKTGDQYLEEKARYELGMVKEDEVYYQFIE